MFHHFAELGGPTLVRSTDFDYRNDPETLVSFLTAVTVTGYQKDAAGTYKSAQHAAGDVQVFGVQAA